MKKMAAIYEKVKIIEDIYIFTFKELIDNCIYNELDDTIRFMKEGMVKTIYNMEDPEFLISDEKLCFSDLMEYEIIDTMYEGSLEEQKESFIDDCKNFMRYIVLNAKDGTIKLINSEIDQLTQAKPDSHFFEYSLLQTTEDSLFAVISIDTISNILTQLENNEVDFVVKQLSSLLATTNNEVQQQKETKKGSEKLDLTMVKELFSDLVGLENIKNEILKLYNYCHFSDKIKEVTELEKLNLHMVFSGNPGTGKTTMARIVAKILHNFGYVNDKFREVTAGDIIEGYIGQTAIKTKKVLAEIKGGVLFIDEAYKFSEGPYANDTLVELIKEMEEKNTVLIFAGYKKEMEELIDVNPGLKSRIGYNMDFRDYTLDELIKMFDNKFEKYQFNITEDAKQKAVEIIEHFRTIERFGNGRFIDNFFEKILVNHANYMEDIDDLQTLLTITSNDIDENIIELLSDKQKTLGFRGGK